MKRFAIKYGYVLSLFAALVFVSCGNTTFYRAILAKNKTSLEGISETPDTDAGKWAAFSMANTTTWMGDDWTGRHIDLDTEDNRDSSIFGALSSDAFQVNSTGTYLILACGALDRVGGSNRSAAKFRIKYGSTWLTGWAETFIRRASGHDSDEAMLYAIEELTGGSTLKLFTQEINSSGSDAYWTGSNNSYTTINSSLTALRLNKNNPLCILEATTAKNHQITANDTDSDMEFDTQVTIDTDYFEHSTTTDADEITLKNAGKYLVCYADKWKRNTDNSERTGMIGRLKLDSSDVAGSWSNNYLRGSQSGEQILEGTLNALTLIETTSANQKLKLSVFREAGAITCERLPEDSRISIYMLHGNEETFSIGSSSTQSLGSTTAKIPDFDSSDWIDSNFTLSSDEIQVTGAKNMLYGGGLYINNANADRVAPRLTLRVNAIESPLYADAAYQRNSGGMESAAINVAGIGEPTDGQKIGAYFVSTAGNTTSYNTREAGSGRLWGIDIDTL
jgi:hypothetical protein